MRIAYSEAWATCFGGIAQEYYAKYLSNIATTNNKEYNSYNGAYFNYETADADETDETWTIRRGDSCEGSVMAILWDLYDSGSEENDYISLGYQAWWNLTTGNKYKTLSDLVQSFYFAYPDKISSLGANLSYFKMAPSRVERYSTTLTETPPSFWWLDKGGSETFPNNSFNVFIFSEDYSSYLNIATTEDSITLTEEQWHTVLSWSGATIHIAVMGTQTDQVVSGGYISEHRDYTKPIYITNQVSDGVIITGTHCPIEGSIDIPSTINGKNVVGIGPQAFRNQSELTSVTLPSTIASIGNRAFQFCYKLKTINMSSTTVTRIEDYTFDTCAISSISLPSTIAYIGEGAFIRSGMHTYIPTNVTFIGDYAYANVTSTTLIIPSSVSTIGTNAFMGCDKLTLYTTEQDRPSTWNINWNSSNRPVVWGCSISSEYVTQFTKTTSNPSNINATNGISNPYRNGYTFGGWYAESDYSGTQYMDLAAAPNGILYAKWNKNSCVAQGTLITLADGTQKAVEELTGNEQLLVWNMLTGTFDTAPILFIDFDSIRTFEIIKLNFSDGTIVKVIDEHAFWDFNLNQYVFVRSDAAKYIGHWFNKQTTDNDGNIIYTKVQLTSVDIYSETTTAWSPVTYGHLCIYVNGMLSMPGATQGLINIFDVNPITMKYDEVAMANDIAQYGLFTYEEFNELVPVSQEVFNAFNGQYLKVAIGKGITTIQQLTALVERYSAFFAN